MTGWKTLTRAGDVTRLGEHLTGPLPASPPAAIHAMSAWRAPNGDLRVLRIGPETPVGFHDSFTLHFARARSNAIVTTARILRTEPNLSYRFPDHGSAHTALTEWRRANNANPAPPIITIMTSTGDVPWGHRVFADGFPVQIYGPTSIATRLGASLPHRVTVVTDGTPNIRRALQGHRDRHPGGTTLVEAGPSVSAGLYGVGVPPAVDELILSIYAGARIPDSVVGGILPDPDRPGSGLASHRQPTIVQEPSGPWIFSRYTRID